MATDVAMKETAMPIAPIHHRGYRDSSTGYGRGFVYDRVVHFLLRNLIEA
jgi:hypothetical protein